MSTSVDRCDSAEISVGTHEISSLDLGSSRQRTSASDQESYEDLMSRPAWGSVDALHAGELSTRSRRGGSSSSNAPSRSRSTKTVTTARAEEWMQVRLAELTVSDLGSDDVVIYSTHALKPPDAFKNVWHFVAEHHKRSNLNAEEANKLSYAPAVLIFCDTSVDEHMSDAFDIMSSISRLGPEAPPVILVQHSMAPELRPKPCDFTAKDLDAAFDAWSERINAGTDDVIIEEYLGGRLAAEVQGRLMQQDSCAIKLNDKVNGRREYLEHICEVEDCVYDIVWDYLRVRLRSGVPAIDEDIGPGIPQAIDDLLVGQKLGQGSCGAVMRLVHPHDRENSSGGVLKMMDKKPLTNFHGMASLKRQIAVMSELSTEKLEHPNITKFYEVYHTDSHILFRMEDGGTLDLYKRLIVREERGLVLSMGKVSSLLKQSIAGLWHMHQRAEIVHRDIKPENMILNERQNDLIIKYADFDTAQFIKPRTMCRGVIGTFPFMAPEVVLERRYDPYPADIWSLGVVVLEVTCRLSILKKVLSLQRPKKDMTQAEKQEVEQQAMQKIHSFCANPRHVALLLEKYFQPELMPMIKEMQTVLEGMLNVSALDRWTAVKMLEADAERFRPSSGQPSPEDCE